VNVLLLCTGKVHPRSLALLVVRVVNSSKGWYEAGAR
jgi:hypothetical protein